MRDYFLRCLAGVGLPEGLLDPIVASYIFAENAISQCLSNELLQFFRGQVLYFYLGCLEFAIGEGGFEHEQEVKYGVDVVVLLNVEPTLSKEVQCGVKLT